MMKKRTEKKQVKEGIPGKKKISRKEMKKHKQRVKEIIFGLVGH